MLLLLLLLFGCQYNLCHAYCLHVSVFVLPSLLDTLTLAFPLFLSLTLSLAALIDFN